MNLRTMYTKLAFGLLALGLISCDDLIHVSTGSADPVLNIDAWVNDKAEVQTIYLTWTQDYFDNDDLPPAVTGASVIMTDNLSNTYEFIEDTDSGDGSYRWTPTGEFASLVVEGRTYTLQVIYDNETFQATSKAGRVPKVDSITVEFEEGEGRMTDNYNAQFYGTDLVGAGDTYWIKTYKNGTFLNKTSEINIAYDAGTSASSGVDGVTFISIVRSRINARDVDEDDHPVSPYTIGDSLYVEMNAITLAAFNYLDEVITQTDRAGGLSELFSSVPLANVSTNIVNLDGNGSSVVGFFNVATTSGYGKTIIRTEVIY